MLVLATRYSLTGQFLAGSALLAKKAVALEALPDATVHERVEHRAMVLASIMQSVAAMETELSEIVMHGPGCHLGTGGIDQAAWQALKPLAGKINRESGVLERWKLVMRLANKPQLDLGQQPCLDARLLVSLRNELTHHKSYWGGALDRASVLEALVQKAFRSPPWISLDTNAFPDRILVGACAEWACRTTAAFLDRAYSNLGVPAVLDHLRADPLFGQFIPPR